MRQHGVVRHVNDRSMRGVQGLASRGIFLRRVVGESMAPVLTHGQVVICWRSPRVHPDDVVIVAHDGLEKIKRIAHARTHHIYLLGDNLGASTDSRQFGWLSHSAVVGRVIWPSTSRLNK